MQKGKFFFYKRKIVRFYSRKEQPLQDERVREAVAFLKKNAFCGIPYSFSKGYREKDATVLFDKDKKLWFCFLDEKRLYFKRSLKVEQIKRQFTNLMLEQDPRSAHRYMTNDFGVCPGDVVVDAGAAEGNFSLMVAEKAARLIIVEPDPEWREALMATFEPWTDKVTIISKMVSDHDSDTTVTIDRILDDSGGLDFLKIDVDGAEELLMAGSARTLCSPKAPRIALCIYHQDGDLEKFSALLTDLGFSHTTSEGYLIYVSKKGLEFPYLRKGVLRAWKPA